MTRLTLKWVLLSAPVLSLTCGSAQAAPDPYAGSSILPKCECLFVRDDQVPPLEEPPKEADFDWPVKVIKTDGQWLLIKDDGRSRADGRPSQGWVRKREVILTAKDPIENLYPTAVDYFTAQLAKPGSPRAGMCSSRLFWLRGMAWEDKSDWNAARDDYKCALTSLAASGVCCEIRGKPYEDEVYAGLARCLSKIMIRNNSALFACPQGIKQLWKTCGCKSMYAKISGDCSAEYRKCVPRFTVLAHSSLKLISDCARLFKSFPRIQQPGTIAERQFYAKKWGAFIEELKKQAHPLAVLEDCDAGEPSGRNYGQATWNVSAWRASREMKRAGANFLIAIALNPRPRTYVDWANALLVDNTHDMPAFGFFIIPDCLGESLRWSDEPFKSRSDIEHKIHCAFNRILETSSADVLRCPCARSSQICDHLVGCGDEYTIPRLCNQALRASRTYERAYMTRGRYYQAKAEEVFWDHRESVQCWRVCRDAYMADQQAMTQAKQVSARKASAAIDKARPHIDRLRAHQKELEETLASVQKLKASHRTDATDLLESELFGQLQVSLRRILTDVEKTTPPPAQADPDPNNVAAAKAWFEAINKRLDVLKRRRTYIKHELGLLQLKFFDFRCGTCEAFERLVTGENANATSRFYYYWNLAIRDVTEAISASPSNSKLVPTEYLVKAALLLMRITPTTLQYEELLPDSPDGTVLAHGPRHCKPCENDPDRLQDMQLAQQAADIAEQAVKMSEYRGPQSLAVWAAGLAGTGDFKAAIRRQKNAISLLDADQQRDATRILLGYCAAKKAQPAGEAACPDEESAASSKAAPCKRCQSESHAVQKSKPDE